MGKFNEKGYKKLAVGKLDTNEEHYLVFTDVAHYRYAEDTDDFSSAIYSDYLEIKLCTLKDVKSIIFGKVKYTQITKEILLKYIHFKNDEELISFLDEMLEIKNGKPFKDTIYYKYYLEKLKDISYEKTKEAEIKERAKKLN